MRTFAIDIERIMSEIGASLDVDLKWTSEGIVLDRPGASVSGDIGYKGTVSNVGGAYAATGSITASIEAHCDRCLGVYRQDVKIPITRIFVEMKDGPEGFDRDDVEKLEGHVIDLAPHIREELILNLPIKLLCGEACKGICPQCGADLNKGECTCGNRIDA